MAARIKAQAKSKRSGRFVKVRKNGESAIDARSTMQLPMGLSRIVRPQAVYRWLAPGLAAYTPRFIETILNGALAGDHATQFTLFDMMLDTWPALASCHRELVQGVTRRDVIFDPYAEEDEKPTESAIEREKLITTAIGHMKPDPTRVEDNSQIGTIRDIMDAWFRGISVLEIIWQNIDTPKQGMIWAPQSTAWVHPCNYGMTQDCVLGLTLPQRPSGYGETTAAPSPRQPKLIAFPPNRFLIAVHKARSGPVLGSPMLRPLAWWWAASNFSSDWLLNLAQVFGLPFRWASYAAASPDQTVTAICDMLANMGSAGWAAFPEGTTLELKEASMGTGGHTPQGDLLDRADGYARMLILGQTMTGQTIASGRGGQAFGTVEAQLKADQLDAACAFVAEVINQQLIPAILIENYGDASEPPSCRFLQETEGTYQDAQRDQILTAMGTDIPISHVRQKYNIPEPTGDEETTKPPPKPTATSSVSPGPKGTRPIGQTPAQPSPSEKPRQVEAQFEISEAGDLQILGRELRQMATELEKE